MVENQTHTHRSEIGGCVVPDAISYLTYIHEVTMAKRNMTKDKQRSTKHYRKLKIEQHEPH